MTVRSEVFGRMPDGREVRRYELHQGPARLTLIEYGAILTEWSWPDREGRVDDVLLGMRRLEDYLGPHPYYGALVGRVAGRVTNARFEADGQVWPLPANEPPHHLHGGVCGFDRQLWALRETGEDADGSWVRLGHESPPGEGYTGRMQLDLRYVLTPECGLRIELEARTDAATPFAPTQHLYFNLSGGTEPTVDTHELRIDAAHFFPTDASFGFLGHQAPVQAGSNDFRRPKRLGEVMRTSLRTHGDMYRLSGQRRDEPVEVAVVHHPESGRGIRVLTTEPCLQLYTGKFLHNEPTPGKHGNHYPAYAGLCLECQGYPSSPPPGMAASLLRPEAPFRLVTEYQQTDSVSFRQLAGSSTRMPSGSSTGGMISPFGR